MQLPHILPPALCCLLTLLLQHVAGLAVPRPAPAVYPANCLGTLPNFDTPEVRNSVYSCIQRECGVASISEVCTACIDNLFFDIEGVEGKSKIAFCSRENKGQVALGQEELQQLDAGELNQFEKAIQQFCTGNDLAFGELRKRSGQSFGSPSQPQSGLAKTLSGLGETLSGLLGGAKKMPPSQQPTGLPKALSGLGETLNDLLGGDQTRPQ